MWWEECLRCGAVLPLPIKPKPFKHTCFYEDLKRGRDYKLKDPIEAVKHNVVCPNPKCSFSTPIIVGFDYKEYWAFLCVCDYEWHQEYEPPTLWEKIKSKFRKPVPKKYKMIWESLSQPESRKE
jgi:hypothetical protein